MTVDEIVRQASDLMDERSLLHSERDNWRHWCIQVADAIGVGTEDLPTDILEQWKEMKKRVLNKLKASAENEAK